LDLTVLAILAKNFGSTFILAQANIENKKRLDREVKPFY